MAIGIVFGPADATADFLRYATMLDNSEVARAVYRDMAGAAGLAVDQLVAQPAPEVGVVELRSLRQVTAMVAIARVLEAEHGRAEVYGGVSLGELAALHLAGSASFDALVGLLRQRHQPDTERDEAIGFSFVPSLDDAAYFDGVADMSVTVDYGPVFGGAGRMIMVSGLRSALESVRTTGPAELQLVGREMADQAYHSVFREPGRQRLDEYLARHPLADPTVPVCTAVPGHERVSSGGEAGEALLTSETRPLSVPLLVEGLAGRRLDTVHAVSSFLGELKIRFGAPTEYCDDRWLTRSFG